jgi:hypothetical protein
MSSSTVRRSAVLLLLSGTVAAVHVATSGSSRGTSWPVGVAWREP